MDTYTAVGGPESHAIYLTAKFSRRCHGSDTKPAGRGFGGSAGRKAASNQSNGSKSKRLVPSGYHWLPEPPTRRTPDYGTSIFNGTTTVPQCSASSAFLPSTAGK
jgi:hypothetical protein